MGTANDSWVSQIRKGVLEIAVLALLGAREMYGFEIVSSLEANPQLAISAGTVYPLLSRLKKAGLIASVWRESPVGPPRKYYTLTDEGARELAGMTAAWRGVLGRARRPAARECRAMTRRPSDDRRPTFERLDAALARAARGRARRAARRGARASRGAAARGPDSEAAVDEAVRSLGDPGALRRRRLREGGAERPTPPNARRRILGMPYNFGPLQAEEVASAHLEPRRPAHPHAARVRHRLDAELRRDRGATRSRAAGRRGARAVRRACPHRRSSAGLVAVTLVNLAVVVARRAAPRAPPRPVPTHWALAGPDEFAPPLTAALTFLGPAVALNALAVVAVRAPRVAHGARPVGGVAGVRRGPARRHLRQRTRVGVHGTDARVPGVAGTARPGGALRRAGRSTRVSACVLNGAAPASDRRTDAAPGEGAEKEEWTVNGLSELPAWALGLIGVLVVVQVGLQVWGLVDLARRERVMGGRKWVWLLVILFGEIVGVVIYLAVGRNVPPEAADPLASASRRRPRPRRASGRHAVRRSDDARRPVLPALWLRGLTKTYGGTNVLDGVDLTVVEGSVFGFLGPNGAGKTTTLRILTGLAKPTAGTARILGRDVADAGDDVRAQVGFLPDVPGFYPWMTAEEFLRFAGGAVRRCRGDVLDERVAGAARPRRPRGRRRRASAATRAA